MAEIRRAPCRGAWYTTDQSAAAHDPHEFFPHQWGGAANCPGWTAEEAGAVALVDHLIRADRELPGLTARCHPAMEHALTQVIIQSFADFAASSAAPSKLFGVPIVFTADVEPGTWKLVSDQGPIADGTTVTTRRAEGRLDGMAAEEFNPGLVASIAAGITLTDEQKRMGLTPEKMAIGVLRLQRRPDLVAQLDAIVDKRYAAQRRDTPFMAELYAQAESAQLGEALAGLHRIADAAGIFPQTWDAASISEVCDMIATWCSDRPTDGMVALLKGEIGALQDAHADLTASNNRLTEALREARDEIARLRPGVGEVGQHG